jgi:hypothetical protein
METQMKLTICKEQMHNEPTPQIVLRDENRSIIAECGAWNDDTFRAEAAEIVRAVNNADALAQLLDEAEAKIYMLQDAWADTRESDALRKKIRAALAAHRGQI